MPRKITMLTAGKALTKTFRANGNNDPYPMVAEFTSMVVEYNTIEDMKVLLEFAAKEGGCLLKGHLSKDIVNERRAGLGLTDAHTDWMVLDYDSDGGFESLDELLNEVDPRLNEVDYIFQHSASSGLKGKSGIRGHVFFMLENQVSPMVLKQWVRKINLTSPKFRARVKLSRNAMAVCYALDTTVNQNDKLIYVAPPILVDIEDPIPARFELHKRENRTYSFNTTVSAEFNRAKEQELLEELQDQAGITPRRPKYDLSAGEEILLNPGQCVVTGVRAQGPYTRVNLNGGDSWAYWHYTDRPEHLYNYKGEPTVFLRDIAPEYYAQLQQKEESKHERPFVFRERSQDTYYNAIYDESKGRISFIGTSASKDRLQDFMRSNGASPQKVVQDWDICFDPTSSLTVDFHNRKVNTYIPSKYMDEVADPSVSVDDFPVISKVLRHICVDEPTFQHFLNWVAHIVQFGTRTQTAWLFSGCEGTGKGITFTYILAPILGQKQCFKIEQKDVEENYNGYFDGAQLLFLDEGDIASSKSADKIMAKLRTAITDEEISIRRMRSNAYQAPNFSNIIVATNRAAAIRLQGSDRRWNIAPRQNFPLYPAQEEIEVLKTGTELAKFMQFLKARPISEYDSIKLIDTQAREDLMTLSRTVAEDFFDALKEGNLDYFAEQLQEEVPMPEAGYIGFAKVIQTWMADAIAGKETVLTLDDLLRVYNYMSDSGLTTKKLSHLMTRYALVTTRSRINGVQKQVVTAKFTDNGYELWLARGRRAGSPAPVRPSSSQSSTQQSPSSAQG